MLFGSIEAGGTKFVCAVCDEKMHILEIVSFPTTTPKETINFVCKFFNKYKNNLSSIGIGSFGPIDIKKDSKTFGFITSTPKTEWQNFNFVGTLKNSFNIPIVWTTDVNAAVYGEYIYGNKKELSSIVYYTIGTGIGGGAIQNGQFIEGFSHTEMGHMIVKNHPNDTFNGCCPFHGNCLEGMASGPAIEKRLGKKGADVSENDEFWDIEAYYIAQCAYNTTLLLSPDKIIFGGGVMKQKHILSKIHKAFKEILNNYTKTPKLEDYIITPKLEDKSATFGCLFLAKEAIKY